MAVANDEAFVREMQARMEKKLREQEIASVQHWKEQVDRILALRPEGVAALQSHLRILSERMENRIRMLKKT